MILHGERIAVEPIIETQTKGGLALPQGTVKRLKGDTLRGRVTFISHDLSYMPDGCQHFNIPQDMVGQVVHYYAGHLFEVVVNDVTYHIIDMGTLLCVED